jgi:hypothetical protein
MAPRPDIAAIKAALPLSQLIGITVGWDRSMTNAPKGDFWALCPFHAERTPSFHVDDRKGLYHCFGCSASGDHVSWCQQWLGHDFHAAIDYLAQLAGVAPGAGPAVRAPAARAAVRTPAEFRKASYGLRLARDIWHASAPGHPLLIDYLAARGVAVAALERTWGGPPPCLRLHPDLEHRQAGRVVHRGPAMVALIARPGWIAGIHRTWITPGGRARLGVSKIPKQWLGATGRMMGCPVRFTAPGPNMVVGEGIETVLAVWSRLQLRHLDAGGEFWSAEAALSLNALTGAADPAFRGPASGRTGRPLSSAVPDMARPSWRAPDPVDRLVILAEASSKDPDEAMRRAWCAQRRHLWRSDGTARRCELRLPPGGWGTGMDFADLAAAEAMQTCGS